MLLVIDSSVVAKWFFAESLTEQALIIREDWVAQKIDLIAPEILISEVSNIVWKKQKTGLISQQEGSAIVANLLALQLPTVSIEPILPFAHSLATTFDLTVYDSVYLALSQSMGTKFITADLRLYNALASKLSHIEYLGNY